MFREIVSPSGNTVCILEKYCHFLWKNTVTFSENIATFNFGKYGLFIIRIKLDKILFTSLSAHYELFVNLFQIVVAWYITSYIYLHSTKIDQT